MRGFKPKAALVPAGLILCVLVAGCGSGQRAAHTPHVIIPADKVRWEAGPAGLPPGGQAAVLEGHPAKPGHFTVRARLPDGYRIPLHWHSSSEQITVLSGIFYLGTGDRFNEGSAEALSAGAYALMPPGMTHYAWCKGETVLQVSGDGPFDIHYVNAADDPRGITR
jgi:quercetin dioxygenase-like cupin family protein